MSSDQNIKIAFFGTPDLCLPYLEALESAGLAPQLIVTNPDRPVGRKHSEFIAPAVKVWGKDHGIRVEQPEELDESFFEHLAVDDWDVFIVIAYGKIMPEKFIFLPTHGTLNVHYSLLPRWRGATPVESTILAADTETGVTVQQMHFKLDSGPILSQARIELDGDETGIDLRKVLTDIGKDLLIETLPEYLNGNITPVEQDETKITTCRRIKKEEGEINFDMSDSELWRRYRAYHPWPGLFFFTAAEKRVKVTDADMIDDVFTILKVVPEGKTEMGYDDFLASNSE